MRQSAERQAKHLAKILCIDPEPRVPEWFPAALRQAGYLVQTMESTQALLEPARLQDFDLLIVDPRNLVYFLRKYGLDKKESRA